MSTTQRSDLILPSVLAEEFSKGIAGMEVLNGSGVFTVNPGLQAGSTEVGNDVTVPYFESIGKAQQVPVGGALSPKKLSMSSESATVVHLGDAVSVNGWAARAKQTGRDLYDIAREQLLAGFRAKLEDLMIDSLVARAVAKSMIYDGSGATVSTTDIVEGQKVFGDELASNGGIRLWVMNSKPYWDLASLVDTTNRPLMVNVPGEELARFGGKPVMMSDRAVKRLEETTSNSFALDLKKWRAIMAAYEGGGHAYHATMPTDALRAFRDTMRETKDHGFERLREAQWRLGNDVRALLAERGFRSVAADGFGAPGVVVSYTDDPDIQSGKKFLAKGVQIAAGVPLQVGEPEGFRTFRIGLFGLDKLYDVEATVGRVRAALDAVA